MTDAALLDDKETRLLAAVTFTPRIGLAWLDLAGGRFSLTELADLDALHAEIERLKPAELLLAEDRRRAAVARRTSPARAAGRRGTSIPAPASGCSASSSARSISRASTPRTRRPASAPRAACSSTRRTRSAARCRTCARCTRERREQAVILDAQTRRNLEIETSLGARDEYTLAGLMDRCATAMGSRLLAPLAQPADPRPRASCKRRQQAVDVLQQSGPVDGAARRAQGDRRSRAHSHAHRAALGAAARPREPARQPRAPAGARSRFAAPLAAERLQALAAQCGEHAAEQALLKRALVETPPVLLRDGGVIAPGYDADFDELRRISTNADQYLEDLETRERARTGIANLKVGYNRVHGFYIELTRGQAASAPADYIRRQTLKGAERYITPELKDFEDKVLSARERSLSREKQLYDELLELLARDLAGLQRTAEAVAELDTLIDLAERARALNLVLPTLVDEPRLEYRGGRHLGVEHVERGAVRAERPRA